MKTEQTTPKYKRVLLKLSGEAMAAGAEKGILNHAFLHEICLKIKECLDCGVQVSVIVGAGNIWRGRQGTDMDHVRADHMGMLATAINALALQDALEHVGIDARVMTAVEMRSFAEPFVRDEAIRHLEAGRVVIFGCGIGTPFFSTDTAAVMRAAEVGADVVLMAKNIDYIYTADPRRDPDAKKLTTVSCTEILSRGLAAIDFTAAAFCLSTGMPIRVFGLSVPEDILAAVRGEKVGTVVTPD